MTTSTSTNGQAPFQTTNTNLAESLRDRFWSKVDVSAGPNGCWPWVASLQQAGYGQFYFEGRPRRATRVLWQMYYGAIPDGLHVLHTCDNRPCVNPAHLYLGNHHRNMRDMAERNRHGTKNGYVHVGRPKLAACKYGHPYDDANTYIAKGHRYCRTCQAERVKAWKFSHRNRRSQPDPDLIVKAKELLQEGFSIRKAATVLGTTHTSLRRWLKGTTFTGVIN